MIQYDDIINAMPKGYCIYNDVFVQSTNLISKRKNDKASCYKIRVYQKSEFKGMFKKQFYNWVYCYSTSQLNRFIKATLIKLNANTRDT